MKITDLLNVNAIELNAKALGKEDVLKQAVELMAKQGNVTDKEQYLKAVMAREDESTTGVGDGIAIPHGRCDGVNRAGLIAMVIPEGVNYEALDDEPVTLLFLIAANTKSGSEHIDILSKLSGMLMHEEFTAALRAAKTPEEFLKVIDEAEEEKDAGTEKKDDALPLTNQKKILAVTGCPTGIAHTFMAAEALEKSAKAKGCYIKVETRGSGGAKNVLTQEEINEADCIIVAADTKVPMNRFDKKKLIEVPVSDGISKADQLIEKAIAGDAPIYKGNEVSENAPQKAKGNIGHQIYKHLMNGVSHMLPFVVGGGILIAIAFLIDGLMVDLNNVPQDLVEQYGSVEAVKSNFGTLTPVAAMLKQIGGVAFGFMLPILAGFIAMSIADRPGLAVGFVGGAIAASGTSGFLGALVAGFVAGYLVKLLMFLCRKFPKSLDGIKPVLIYPVVGILLIGIIMYLPIETAVGALNTAMNQALSSMSGASSVILGIIVAGMMAIDMGGPFNKAAYVFGTAAIAAGNYDIMAAVMIGGMVPPCAIALATLLFKNKFTAEERKNGPTNFIMGLAFITEGAIPYAAADPLHVIPACIIGSGVAGALSMAFHCTLMAPHGGIFVFPVVGNALFYLLSLVVGTLAGTLLLGAFKKKVEK
ncbi:MAG: fructose-specific PTS transporter subunit EIIC [Lachnospiraceae bacterium]